MMSGSGTELVFGILRPADRQRSAEEDQRAADCKAGLFGKCTQYKKEIKRWIQILK